MIALLTPALLRETPLPRHEGEIDKDDRGRVLAIGGSAEMPGGLLLAGLAAMRAGAGKLQLATVASRAGGLAIAVPEARVIALAEKDGDIDGSDPHIAQLAARAGAVIVGPGMLDNRAAAGVTAAVLAAKGEPPILLDAAALHDLGEARALCRKCAGRLVLTPHAGEMAKLMAADVASVIADAAGFASRAAREFGAVVAMKGGVTHVAAPDGRGWRFEGGCVGLATSGSGDVLAGIIGGLLARGADPATATLWGVHLHGAAGNRLSTRIGPLGFLARELPDEVPRVLADFV